VDETNLKRMKYLILGSAGQIGYPLCKYLLEKNHDILEFDLQVHQDQDLRIYNNEYLSEKMAQADFVFFLAFDVGGSRYLAQYENTFQFLHNNVLIMENVFAQLEKHKLPFIFASSQMSNMIYSPYGTAKALGEKYTEVLGGLTVKFWNVYALEKDFDKAHVITDFIYKAKTNRKIDMLTDGTEMRQFLHGDDCSKCLYTLSRKFDQVDKQKEYHITSFEWTSILKVAQIIAKEFPGTEVFPARSKDTIQKDIRNEPNPYILQYWNPEIDLTEGIKRIIEELV